MCTQTRKKPKGITISPALIGLRLLPARRTTRRRRFFFSNDDDERLFNYFFFVFLLEDEDGEEKTHFINLVFFLVIQNCLNKGKKGRDDDTIRKPRHAQKGGEKVQTNFRVFVRRPCVNRESIEDLFFRVRAATDGNTTLSCIQPSLDCGGWCINSKQSSSSVRVSCGRWRLKVSPHSLTRKRKKIYSLAPSRTT